jgi:hypothetical protein
MGKELKNKIANFFGIVILLLLGISVYKLRTFIDISNYKKFLGSTGGLLVAWYGIAGFLYIIIAGDSKVTETKNFKINNKSFSVTKETGETRSGDEEGGKILFKIWWLLSPIYFAFWNDIKNLYSYNYTEHSNLNIIIKFVLLIGSLMIFVYSIIVLNKQELSRKILRYLMYGFLILYILFLIIGCILWAMK